MLAAVTLVFLFAVQVIWAIWSDYQNTIETEYEHLSIRARLTEAQLSGSFRSVDLLLRTLNERRIKDINAPLERFRNDLKNSLSQMPEISALFATTAQGIVFGHTEQALDGFDATQREYFKHHADSAAGDDGLFISKPFKGSAGRQVFTASRALRGPAGKFMGVMVARLEVGTFTAVFRQSVPQKTGAAALLFTDGDVLFRWPDPEHFIGSTLRNGIAFSEHMASGAIETRHRNVASTDGIERISVFRRLHPDKLMLVVSRDVHELTAPWRVRALQRLGALVLISAITALAFILIQRRQREIERAQRFSERIIETSPAGVTIYDREGRCVAANEAMARQIGGTLESVKAQNYHELASWKKAGLYELALQTQHTGEATSKVIHVMSSFKQEVWLSVTFSALETGGRLMMTTYDLSDFHRVQQLRQETEDRFAMLFSNSMDGVLQTMPGGPILAANPAACAMLGRSEEALCQLEPYRPTLQPPQTIFDTSDPRLQVFFEERARNGRARGEITMVRANGERFEVEVSSALYTNPQGQTLSSFLFRDISDRKKAEERINELAFFDQLTALPNRTLLLDRLKQAMAASSRNGSHGALLFIDLDNFKTINDTLGHDVGDLLLKQVAQRLTQGVREVDTVARLGGDEFVVLLAGLSTVEEDAAAGIETVVEKILAALNQTYHLGPVVHHSTASMGVAVFGRNPVAADGLMKQAELAMYKSKEAGRNAWRFFDPHMESAVKERAVLEKDLRRALEEKQFLLHYQAQVVSEGRITGAEVLVRWQHPLRGMVSPAEFIPFAEETGLILPLGHWVLESACTQLASWASRPEMAHLTVAVNVSAHQFRQADFVEQVLTVLKTTGANPQRLKLELTETLLVSHIEDVIDKMFALKAKGVGFSLDDFGTGYSSLTYLKRLPLDQLKIDQSFVRDVLIDPNDAAIAKTIVALAQSLGLGVIAEGVETAAQRDFLAHSGCHAYQGYFFSRPLPLDKFEEFAQRV